MDTPGMQRHATLGFGPLLRKLRKKRDISLNKLAKTLGVSAPYLSDVENGNRSPLSSIRIEEVAKALKVDALQLYIQAGIDRNQFKIPANVSDQHDRVAAVLINCWEKLTEEDLEDILRVLQVA